MHIVEWGELTTTLNMIFSVVYYLELHSAIYSIIHVIFYQVQVLMFYNVQTTNSTFVDKK